MNELVLEALQSDLANFADPGTQVQVDDRGATWIRGRKEMSITLRRGEGELPAIVFGSRSYTYKSFFASEHMADLPALAEVIVHTMDQPKWYVDAPARLEDSSEAAPAKELLVKTATQELPFGATRVVFVRGSAGAGKTVALRQTTIEQAERVAIGDAEELFLYIDAQARALARFDDAVALVLQDLGARFTYRALATLTRLGLLIPIIDGFDELVGVGGHGEAFDSLARLLARLHGKGALIASARSTFYQYRDFRQSAARYEKGRTLNFEIVPLDILPWTNAETAQYLRHAQAIEQLGASSAEGGVDLLRERLGEQGEEFLQTPFFVATLVELIQQRAAVMPEQRLVSQIILHFITREKEKLRDTRDLPITTEEGHLRFLEMLTEEMWWQGTRELDVATVKVISELAADEILLHPGGRLAFVERSPSYAFLDSKEHEGLKFLTFTHEYYYSYFLGRFLARALTNEDENPSQVLVRGRLSPLAGDEFAHALRERELDSKIAARHLSHRRVTSLTREVDTANAGTLFAGLIRHWPATLTNEVVVNCSFIQEALAKTTLIGTAFSNCEFLRCDLTGAEWTDVRASGCLFSEPIVDIHGTRLGGLQLSLEGELIGLVRRDATGDHLLYDPREIAEIARSAGIITEADEGSEVELSESAKAQVEVLRKFLRIATRLFYVSDEDLSNRGLMNQDWLGLERRLIDLDLMEFVAIQRRGPRNQVRRLRVPPIEIEKGEAGASANPSIAALWSQVRAL